MVAHFILPTVREKLLFSKGSLNEYGKNIFLQM